MNDTETTCLDYLMDYRITGREEDIMKQYYLECGASEETIDNADKAISALEELSARKGNGYDRMKIIINDSLYEMGRKEYKGVLKIASEQIPCGIYAVEKDGICELRKDTFESEEELKKAVAEYAEIGFKVNYDL